ncbi:MAG TPA: hypothetical protein VG891_12710 [Rhizomicrobium sp.]|nr:hypothetical protein [Rhizomicrobium sp.]
MRNFAVEQAKPATASSETPARVPERPRKPARRQTGVVGLVFALIIACFWIGCASAYLLGYAGPRGLGALDIQEMALYAAIILAPPILFIATAWAFARGQAMGQLVGQLSERVELLVTADDMSARTAAKLGRTVRHELDALNAGIDGAFQRLRALESVLQGQIAALDEAGARTDVRGEAIAKRLMQERERLESIGGMLGEAAARAGETVTAHATQLKTIIDSAQGALAASAAETGDTLSGRASELRGVIESTRSALAGSVAEVQSALAARTEDLKAAIASAQEALAASATGVGDVLSDRAQELKSTVLSAEEAFSASTRRAHDILAGQVDQLKQMIGSAGDVLLDGTIRAHELLAERTERANDLIATRVTQMKSVIESTEGTLDRAAGQASEHLAGRVAQLQSIMEMAEGKLAAASQSLEKQTSEFRASVEAAAQAPHNVAVELDARAKQIEQVADATMARAEFVLGRHERHRAQMNDLLQKLREEGQAFEQAVQNERAALEKTIAALSPEAKKFETLASDTERHVEMIMSNAAARAANIAGVLAAEASRLTDIGAAASDSLTRITETLRQAGESAHMLIGDTASTAKANANALVSEAMSECEKLIRAASELAAKSKEVSADLDRAVSEVNTHMATLPGIAQQEARRVREMLRTETEEILDLSARTIATIHARTSVKQPRAESDAAQNDPDSLLSRARKLTQRPRRKSEPRPVEPSDPKGWNMSTLLAAVENSESPQERQLRPASAAALGALEAALSDLAIDLAAFDTGPAPGEDEWRRYLAGDRTIFARRLADAIDSDAMNRIANLYRENAKFREAADTYIADFEVLLNKAKEGDGGGLLTSTMLSADTGKIYLALAYALGRLS